MTTTALIILAIGGWLAFACMSVVARVLSLILRDRARQVEHLKRRLHAAQAELDQQWNIKWKAK